MEYGFLSVESIINTMIQEQSRSSFSLFLSISIVLAAFHQSPLLFAKEKKSREPNTFSVKDFGAKGNHQTLDTEAIQKAFDAAKEAGGGTVIIPKGRYLSGALFMYSNTTLILEDRATLEGIEDLEYYPIIDSRFNGTEQKCHASLLTAIDAHNITITGEGTIAGSGVGRSGVPTGPRTIEFIRCKDVVLENIFITNKGRWTVHPLYCKDVIIRGVDIRTTGHNGDGIDPDSCDTMLITDCSFFTKDDSIAIKSGKNRNGVDVGIPCTNITITNCKMRGGYAAVACGSEMSGGINNVLFTDCYLTNMTKGFDIKTRNGRGGTVEDIVVSNLKMVNVDVPLIMRMNYKFNTGNDLIEGPEGIPTIRNITIKDITIDGNQMGNISGTETNHIDGLILKNITCNSGAKLGLNYIDGVTMKNITNENGKDAVKMVGCNP
jgi:polygalacturonase